MAETIRSVERALDVLMCFTKQTSELSMTQVSECVGINKSTVHRLLATLEGKRFVERDAETGNYRPGIRLVQLAFLTLESNDLQRLARPYLNSLCEQYEENVNLSVLDETDVVYLEVIESHQRVMLAASPGQRLPAFCTASGKAILAYLSEDKVTEILNRGMVGHTQNTILTKEELLDNLKSAQENGFAISEGEYEEGINAIAVPVMSSNGKPIASVSIAGPAYRLTRERIMEIGPDFVSKVKELSEEVELAGHFAS